MKKHAPRAILRPSTHQRGASLLVVLGFVMGFSMLLAALARYTADDAITHRAQVAGDQAVQLARAARIYVRDQYANGALTKTQLDPTSGGAPVLISVDELINRRLLPANFGNRQPSGLYLNGLGQPMYPIAANNPVTAASALPSTVPTAYILLGPSTRYTSEQAERANAIASGRMKENGLPVNPPTYDGTGNLNVGCGASQTGYVANWDTGCLSIADYAVLRTADATNIPTVAAFQGSMLIPAWRAVKEDGRALSRFAQPENPAATSMSTDLYMAKTSSNTAPCVSGAAQTITSVNGAGAIDTTQKLDTDSTKAGNQDLCVVADDTVTDNNRFDIENVATLSSGVVVAQPQATRKEGAIADLTRGGTPMAARIEGNMVVHGNAVIANNTALPAGVDAPLVLKPGSTLSVTNGGMAFKNAGGAALDIVQDAANPAATGNLNVKTAQAKTLSAASLYGKNNMVVKDAVALKGALESGSASASVVSGKTFTIDNGQQTITADHAVFTNTNANRATVALTGSTVTRNGSTITAPIVVGTAANLGVVEVKNATCVGADANGNCPTTAGGGDILSVAGASTITGRLDTNTCASGVGGRCPRASERGDDQGCRVVLGTTICSKE